MARRAPDGPPPRPVVQRVRVHYAKRGRLRFTSHRDFQRAFERALRRSAVPMAYSAGFTPHPRISFANAAPTGTASEAEYLEIGLVEDREPKALRDALDASLPPGLDVVEAVTAAPDGQGGSLADRLEASVWRLGLPGVGQRRAQAAVSAFLAEERIEVERLTKNGVRRFDAREPVVVLEPIVAPQPVVVSERARNEALTGASDGLLNPPCAILRLVVRHVTPAVRPDDVLTGLRSVADLAPRASDGGTPAVELTRIAQGPLEFTTGTVTDPLAPDRAAAQAA